MKIAVLIQCHKCPEQVNMLISMLDHPSIDCYVHVDKKSNIQDAITHRDHVYFIDEENKVDVQWGRISLVDAALQLLQMASQKEDYDFYWFCSGQDFPLKSANEIVDFFSKNANHDFIELFCSLNSGFGRENSFDKRNIIFFPDWMIGGKFRTKVFRRLWTELTGGYNKTYSIFRRKNPLNMKFYYGSTWFCLSGRTIKWIHEYMAQNPVYYRYFCNCNCPDESFFQTLVMNSPYSKERKNYLHYVDWSEHDRNHHPKTLTMDDFDKLINSKAFMARKFDISVDKSIIERLISYIQNSPKTD